MAAGPSTVKRHAHELAVDRDGKRHITEPPSGSASPAPEAPERMYCVCRQSYGTPAG